MYICVLVQYWTSRFYKFKSGCCEKTQLNKQEKGWNRSNPASRAVTSSTSFAELHRKKLLPEVREGYLSPTRVCITTTIVVEVIMLHVQSPFVHMCVYYNRYCWLGNVVVCLVTFRVYVCIKTTSVGVIILLQVQTPFVYTCAYYNQYCW